MLTLLDHRVDADAVRLWPQAVDVSLDRHLGRRVELGVVRAVIVGEVVVELLELLRRRTLRTVRGRILAVVVVEREPSLFREPAIVARREGSRSTGSRSCLLLLLRDANPKERRGVQ